MNIKHIFFSHALLPVMLLCCLAWPAAAAVEYRQFTQPEQEESYRMLIGELRCLVCQNQAIADSNADLARDLRQQVYDMLRQGKSSQEIIDFMTERYGDFVLYKPAFNLKTWLLWLGPALLLLAGLLAVFRIVHRKNQAGPPVALSRERQDGLIALLEEGDGE